MSITGSIASVVVCAQQSMSCPDDFDPNANSGEDVAIFVKGATGSLVLTNSGGAKTGQLTATVYATIGSTTEYKVVYKSATGTPTTDVITISDTGTKSSLTIPATIVAPGSDSGPDAFELAKTSGNACPQNEITEQTEMQGGAQITLTSGDTNVVTAGGGQNAPFSINFLASGSTTVTAAAGSSTVVYPANVPKSGFASGC